MAENFENHDYNQDPNPPVLGQEEEAISEVSEGTFIEHSEAVDASAEKQEPFVASPHLHPTTPVHYSGRASATSPVEGGDEKRPPQQALSDTPDGVHRMQKFILYETSTRYYIVGSDSQDERYRMLKIDRTVDPGELSIIEDDVVYSKDELTQLLAAIEDGNLAHGGLKKRCAMWGILGFIRFTTNYYMLVITQKTIVAMLGGHYIYQIEATELVPIITATSTKKADKNPEEARFMGIFGNLDLTKNFYFSYSYDISRTLQYNLTKARESLKNGLRPSMTSSADYNEMFAWNHYLLQPALQYMTNTFDWCLPLLHGFLDQRKISVFGRPVYVTLIARRSRYFAGARFLKRGANDLGYVANDVESEQIVSDMRTTSFHAPGGILFGSPNYTSYVQHRGSIPLYWSQESSPSVPKPPITLNLVDPFFSAAALHFDQLFNRYGAPIIVLNLIKSRERVPRESLLLHEFTQAVNYLKKLLPNKDDIIYKAWDMSRVAKSRDQDVVEKLEETAEDVLKQTGIFHNGYGDDHPIQLQRGVCRTNCIDCLDRTNAAQFVIGKRALGMQLKALGIIEDGYLKYDTDVSNLFTHMYHDHGDSIALQYGGSHLVNTMETYRKINQWSSQSRDMIESFKRYYNNSFMDAQRQEAINLFLGNYIFAKGQPMLWDLETDYYLHHADPRMEKNKRSYVKWWTDSHLEKMEIPPVVSMAELNNRDISFYDEFWSEYYRPKALSAFPKIFAYRMASTSKSTKTLDGANQDPSPFAVRSSSGDKDNRRKRRGVKILDPTIDLSKQIKRLSLQRWLTDANGGQSHHSHENNLKYSLNLSLNDSIPSIPGTVSKSDKETLPPHLWTMDQIVHHSLNPSVSKSEKAEYERYVTHPLNLPMVPHEGISNPPRVFVDYLNSGSPSAVANLSSTVEDEAVYRSFVDAADNYIAGVEDMPAKLRYKAYQGYVAGKGFKQLRAESLVKG
ncbi:phosphatidylinositol-3,5-bisphosphate 5-phosphatase [Orbilia oligospora]|uniref:Phosphatidylinositol-3,5-bisphosphate 5-phosphatase n=1 Tax=Orbilia oligospora TaxID=2813651 RepID=A0A7C8P9B3_ORBOL|nr:phosphatidylinositol-3,5-bisphosphate 5-phosphatase [Orbilia oligospora]KAF3207063.1 phosphatidylinositol-3,5-bisphosphate 5-phosphatase [Orbilia oligospora]KAF3218079.1 phosphatidylinositol-3,5-bisphosphate 5-phosphatase [Orbilia oligospora]